MARFDVKQYLTETDLEEHNKSISDKLEVYNGDEGDETRGKIDKIIRPF